MTNETGEGAGDVGVEEEVKEAGGVGDVGGPAKAGPLATATAAVGLLAGIVAAVYVLGGLVIALRMLFDHFALNTVVVILGQLPREPVVTTALLGVIGPAATVGLLAALMYGAFDRPRPRAGDSDDLNQGPHWKRTLVFLGAVSFALALPAIFQAWRTDGFSLLLLTSLVGIAVTFGLAAAGWFMIRRVGRTTWLRLPKAAAAGALWAGIAITPSVMLASSLPFEQAQVCTSVSATAETGRFIGEGGNRVLLEQQLDDEASVVALPADKVTRSEFGDLSSTFACPVPPGAEGGQEAAVELDHGGVEEQRLATALRPRLLFDRREPWRPLAVDLFLVERFPREGGHGICARGTEPPCPLATGLGRLRLGKGAPAYVDIHGSAPNGADAVSPDPGCSESRPAVDCNSGPAAVIYYRRTANEGLWYWDYWWFMRYNDYTGRVNRCLVVCGDHEGDWEGITVVTTAAAEPEVVRALYASHSERLLVDGASLPWSEGHLAVYVAKGTHASYPYACDGDCKQYSTRVGFHLPEDPHDGAVPWGANRDRECAANQCVRPLPEVGDVGDGSLPLAGAWAGWPGRWGETCHNGCRWLKQNYESSPPSPGAQIRFRCPWVPTLRLKAAGDLSRSEPVSDGKRLRRACEALRGGR